MSLVISAIASDGIVMMGDGLTTRVPLDGKGECVSGCEETDKIFSFLDYYAVGNTGRLKIYNSGISQCLFDLEQSTADGKISAPHDLNAIPEFLRMNFVPLIGDEYEQHKAIYGTSLLPFLLNFHVAGYQEGVPTIASFNIVDKYVHYDRGGGISVLGPPSTIAAVLPWDKKKPIGAELSQQPLQNAIDFVYDLMQQAIQYESQSERVPTIGGVITIGTVIPETGFEWAATSYKR